jgi:hypothetical protein
LTAIDLGNSESIKNRNRIYDEGVTAMIEGMILSNNCLISELHLKSASITSEGIKALNLLNNCDLQILDLANNDLGNDAA